MISVAAEGVVGADLATVRAFLRNFASHASVLPFVSFATIIEPPQGMWHLSHELTALVRERMLGVSPPGGGEGEVEWKAVGGRLAMEGKWRLKAETDASTLVRFATVWRLQETVRMATEPALRGVVAGYPEAAMRRLTERFW